MIELLSKASLAIYMHDIASDFSWNGLMDDLMKKEKTF